MSDMATSEGEVLALMSSVQGKYFPELTDCVFQIERVAIGLDDIDIGVEMQVIFGSPMKVTLRYSDSRVVGTQYRIGLVPIIAHELAHIISPIDPEQVMAERLPLPIIKLWQELREAGLANCSMDMKNEKGNPYEGVDTAGE